MGLLKFLVFVELLLALVFFSGRITVDQVTDTVARAEHAATTFYQSLTARTVASARK